MGMSTFGRMFGRTQPKVQHGTPPMLVQPTLTDGRRIQIVPMSQLDHQVTIARENGQFGDSAVFVKFATDRLEHERKWYMMHTVPENGAVVVDAWSEIYAQVHIDDPSDGRGPIRKMYGQFPRYVWGQNVVEYALHSELTAALTQKYNEANQMRNTRRSNGTSMQGGTATMRRAAVARAASPRAKPRMKASPRRRPSAKRARPPPRT